MPSTHAPTEIRAAGCPAIPDARPGKAVYNAARPECSVCTPTRSSVGTPNAEAVMHSYLQRVADHEGHCANREFAELPHVCPICGRTGEPYRLAARSTNVDDTAVDFALQCPRPACRHIYVAGYRLGSSGEYELEVEPWQRHAPRS